MGVALAAAILIGVTWKERADDLCRKDAPTASGYSVGWEWSEFAYVCDFRIRSQQPKRIGITDAFHSDRPRHGSKR